MNPILYPISFAGFVLVTILSYGWTLQTVYGGMSAAGFPAVRRKKVMRIILGTLIVWTAVISLLALKGFFSDFRTLPPKILIVFIVPFILMLVAIFSKTMKEILPGIPSHQLIRLQVFRVFVEILLWMLLVQNILPVQMTLEGRNFDILTGLTAPLVAWLISKQARSSVAIVLWNVAGLMLLINVVIIAILSAPTPFRVFMNEPSNTIIALFPFVWLPGLLVPLAYGLHLMSIRKEF